MDAIIKLFGALFVGIGNATMAIGRQVLPTLSAVHMGVTAPIRALAEREGTAPNENMFMTRLVKRAIGMPVQPRTKFVDDQGEMEV